MGLNNFGKTICCLIVLNSVLMYANGQRPDRCATVAAQNALLQKDPSLAARSAQMNQLIREYINSHPVTNNSRSILTIPVVVHIVNNGEPIGSGTNITDAQALSQLDVLNLDFRRLNADTFKTPPPFKALAADFQIEFCIAVRDPNGMPTSGIDRVYGGRTTWTSGQIDSLLKPRTIWDRTQYLNIWTVAFGGSSGDVLGYAIPPDYSNDSIDGVVIGYNAFGNMGNVTAPYNTGRTATHEIGHWVGLYHPWGLNPPNVASCNEDDSVPDTPHAQYANYGCPQFPHVTCAPVDTPNGDMFMDFMDYTDDDCMNLFTLGQKARSNAVMHRFRTSIQSSLACTRYAYDAAILQSILPGAQVCDTTFRPLIKMSNEGSTNLTECLVNVVVDNGNLIQVTWQGNLAPGQSQYHLLDPLTLSTGTHNVQIYLSAPNNQIDQNNANDGVIDTFVVLANPPGQALPFAEGFELGSGLPAGWSANVIGRIDTIEWKVNTSVGAGGSLSSVWADNFTGTHAVNSKGNRSNLEMPVIAVGPGKYPHLTFDVAYARRDTTSNDSLLVAYSLDCGSTWHTVYAKGGPSLMTTAPRSTAFVPGSGDWRNDAIDLPQLSGQDHVLIRFQDYSGWGNNVYVDNVNITELIGGIKVLVQPQLGMIISPNPSQGIFTATFDQPLPENSVLEVFDLLGRSIYTNHSIAGKSVTIDLSATVAGVYLAKVTSGGASLIKKLVIQ